MKHIFKKRLIPITIIVIITFVVFSDTYTGRYIRWNLSDVYDLKKFSSVKVENNGDSALIILKKQNDLIHQIIFDFNGDNCNIDDLINNTRTNALVITNIQAMNKIKLKSRTAFVNRQHKA